MSLQIPRRHYGIFLLDSRQDRAEPTLEILRQADFEPRYFAELKTMREALLQNPPHLVFFHRGDELNPVAEALVDLRERLPETHFLVLSSAGGLAATWREWGGMISDCVLTPAVHPRQLVQAVLRCSERDAYLYRAEELAEKLAAAQTLLDQSARKPTETNQAEDHDRPSLQDSIAELEDETAAFLSAVMEDVSGVDIDSADASADQDVLKTSADFDFGATWHRLVQARQLDDLVGETLKALFEQVDEAPTIFLRHLPNRRLLLTTAAHGLPTETWKNLGLNLAEEPGFVLSDLRHPQKLSGLRDLANSLTQSDDLWVMPLVLREDVFGLFAVMRNLPLSARQRLDAIMQVANERGRLLDMQQYLHAIEIHDPSTLVLNRPALLKRLSEEIARARRLESPVSLLSISLDQYRELLAEHGIEEAQMAVRALTKIIQPRSRANDVLGRLSAEELGLVLPHTSREGATIKAERLRKLISAADFGRMLPRFATLTVSVGVSEYPTCCRDVDDLLSTADDALWQVKDKVSNKVCVSTPVAGFTPDFRVLAGT